MEVHIMVISMKIIYMAKVSIDGLMVVFIKGHGRIIRCMAMESLHGLMEDDMKGNTRMTRNMGKAHFNGAMDADTLEGGTMVNSTA
jgi:hypothetical protein